HPVDFLVCKTFLINKYFISLWIVRIGKLTINQSCLSSGAHPLSLDIPQEFMANLPKIEEWLKNQDLTKMVEEASDQYGHLSSAQRLQGWSIEMRRRISNVVYDAYFYHQDTNATFRSINEVLRFILPNGVSKVINDVLPAKRKQSIYLLEPISRKKARNETQENMEAVNNFTFMDKKEVEDFFEKAFDNLINN
ncbi:hypothetical protein LINPERHAP2_LOCUS33349, partial [Linum perenne]